ncbi:MAG: NAD+ synthase [Actinobacteria bacterium]|nr:NAD+ synthase [Actinomycetota bacterium]
MPLRTALAQLNPVVGDIDGNVGRILEAWRAAADDSADIVVFPELAVTGYPPEDLLFKPEFVAASERAVQRLAADGPPGTVAVVGYVRIEPAEDDTSDWDVRVTALRDRRNSAAVLANGELVGVYDKARLPNYGVFDEARYFVGDDDPLITNVAGVPVGITICEDLWIQTGPVADAARLGAAVVVNLNASPYQRGKRAERERWVRHHAVQHRVAIAYVNCVGGQDELVFDGDSLVAAPGGEVVARGQQFDTDLVLADLAVRTEPVAGIASLPGHRGVRAELPPRDPAPRLDDVAEVWHAVVLGTRDYCRKNGFRRVTLGLSGGIDSSLTAAVAADAVGAGNVLGVRMPSPYSSEESLSDAAELVKNLGIHETTIPIEPGMGTFDDMLGDLFEGTEPDQTEENIQARLRGMLLMAISNKFGHLVLATGNKSEASVGYATLYGDMVGGFMPLKDCNKQLVYALARYRNERGAVIPERVLTKAPSAELRADQTDEEALGPYEVLDPILHRYIEEDRGVEAIIDEGFDEQDVRRVIGMVDRAEWKRRQAPPGIKISQRAFGKDRRVPITNAWRS